MKKFGQAAAFVLISLVVIALCGCGNLGQTGGNSHGNGSSGLPPKPDVADYFGQNDVIADFSKGLSNRFWAAHGYSNGGMFDTVWKRENAFFAQDDGTLHLAIGQDGKYSASGAEYRSAQKYSFGYFSVKMQPIKKIGTVSSFFVYTGPAEGTPWDEIDVEFLGKDTTKVQFNYFSNGKGGHEFLYDLGFDASQELHEYAFLWQKDSITWFVDGKAVYQAQKDIPQTPARIMMNVWVGNPNNKDAVGWLGKFDGVFPVGEAKYQWVGYKSTEQ